MKAAMVFFYGISGLASVFTWLMMVVFAFGEFGGWGYVALAGTPVLTGVFGPPLIWLAYGIPTIILGAWGLMIGSGFLALVCAAVTHND